MDIFECIRTRRSIRKYKEKPVEWDKVVNLLEAGKFAPSAGNLQDVQFLVVKDEGKRKKISRSFPAAKMDGKSANTYYYML